MLTITRNLSRQLIYSVATLLLAVRAPDAFGQGTSGCPSGPYTSCNNHVPVTNINGQWLDYTSGVVLISEWTMTGETSPGVVGSVSGTVRVPNPVLGSGCPDVSYTATGTINPTNTSPGSVAST
jgi:hypothetical protein